MKVWIDVDNPPQVQYLVPFADAFRARGVDVVLTARDYGETLELLKARGVPARPFGHRFGRGAVRKGAGSVARASALIAYHLRAGRPDVLLCASRSSALAAAALRMPSFVLADYEHASVGVYRLTGSCFLHPESVDTSAWTGRGLRPSQLRAFRGIKEDITFVDVDIAAEEPLQLPGDEPRVLLRPPAEDSHYHAHESRRLALSLLERLAARDDVRLVFSPRYARQRAYVEALEWRVEPIVLTEPVPFVPLLKAVDVVVCAGGTMLREAAYLGVPAYTILRSELGGVDRWLASIGRVQVVAADADLETIEVRRRGPLVPLRENPHLLEELADVVLAGASRGSRGRTPTPQPQT